jgi:hypothetical protein
LGEIVALKRQHLLRWFEERVDSEVERAVGRTLRQFRGGLLPTEENVTAALAADVNRRLLTGIRRRFGDEQFRQVRVQVNVYNPVSAEPLVGADFGAVVEVVAPGYRTEKAILVQAKLSTNTDYPSLLSQCEKMLAVSPDSFVVVYGRGRVSARVFSAHSLRALRGNINAAQKECYSGSFGGLLKQMIRTFVGDHRIASDILRATQLAKRPERNELPVRSLAIRIVEED